MNKTELVERIAGRTKQPAADVAAVVNAFMETVTKTVASGEKVVLSGFGTFHRKQRAARVARDIWADKPLKVRASNVPAFNPGKPFKDAVARRRRSASGSRPRSGSRSRAIASGKTPRSGRGGG